MLLDALVKWCQKLWKTPLKKAPLLVMMTLQQIEQVQNKADKEHSVTAPNLGKKIKVYYPGIQKL
jgi:hypothetical protein